MSPAQSDPLYGPFERAPQSRLDFELVQRLHNLWLRSTGYVEHRTRPKDLFVVEGSWQYNPWRGLSWLASGPGPAPEYDLTDAPWQYRKLETFSGFRHIEGTVTVGVVTGVDVLVGEASYNYLGLKRRVSETEGWDFEGGFIRRGNSPNWFVFYSQNGTPPVYPDWPPGGLAPGGRAIVKVYCPAPNRVILYVEILADGNFVPQERTWDLGAPGLNPDGSYQKVRRMTNLKVDTTGSSLGNRWDGVKIGLSGQPVLWLPPNTETYETVSTATVSFQKPITADHTEGININVN